ncbi:phosphatidate cytidylyltransferase [Paraflavitalea sp. CAU 1676]|uniref:phosphatidate cytidylyltransferase n=1 Tax=Paraflavitalea sp. CAU 1676 TaxID=3032598 RepID=UPI0023DB0CDC|nr:phosphatidate cytidylyltransferase [Paraflavitalea sp. CAU 1676]MDF2191421.1 phosphatidate cytidylyltransferase [Paraflavitalea sp. CAU 1676]
MIRLNYLLLAVCAMVGLSSCEVIGGIFKAGVWTGILIVAAVVGLIIFIIARMAGKK